MSMNEKDVVAGKINLDTTKILPAFKVIDEGVRNNAESFKVLNAELVVAEKNYVSMAKAMDKMALTSDERRKKILDESNALVAQRKAAADLLTAKKSQLDAMNQIVESKLQAQLAIQKKKEDAIEQQEKEHQKRLETLANRATTSGAQASRATGSSLDYAARERVLQEEQKIRAKLAAIEEAAHQKKIKDIKEEAEAATKAANADIALRERVLKEEQEIRRKIAAFEETEHQKRIRNAQTELAVRERALQEEQRIRREIDRQAELAQERIRRANQETLNAAGASDSNGVMDKIKNAAIHATMFHAVYSSINTMQHALKESLVDIEANMAGYVQTNEHYFVKFNEGTHEMVMNTSRLNEETTKFIQTAHDLGSNILDVTESARLWGRMYKDVNVVQEMVRQSTKLSTVDLVGLVDATKMMESVMAQYGVQIRNTNDAQVQGNRVLDSWSSVAHNTMAPAKDLGAAFERTGKIAAETGVSFDFMNGLISSGIRNTALGGANLGNMWKTVLGTIRTDKAVGELTKLGVETKKTVDGVEEWRKAEDILLDLSIAVIDKNYDLTQSYADISRGVFQFAKLAASMNVGDILLGESASINSTGLTLDYLKVQMDTIQRKAAQTKASLLEIFSKAGDDGLRSAIKNSLDILDQLLIGLTKVPKGIFEAAASVTGLIILYKTVVPTLMLWKNAQQALTTALALNTVVTNAETIALVAQAAAARNAAMMTALATGGITLLTGAVVGYLYMLGRKEKAERDNEQAMKDTISANQQMVSQMDRQMEFVPKVAEAYKKLQVQYDNLSEAAKTNTDAQKKQLEIKGQLEKLSQALTATIKTEGLEQLKAAGFTAKAVQIQVDKINEARSALNAANLNMKKAENADLQKQLNSKVDDMNKNQDELNGWVGGSRKNPLRNTFIAKNQREVDADTEAIEKLNQKIKENNLTIAEMESQPAMDKLAGEEGKQQRADADYENVKTNFSNEISKVKHLINMKTEGYVSAAEQMQKLAAIRNKYKGQLNEEDLYSIDEDIFRTGEGNEIKAKGSGGGSGKEAFKFPLNDIDNQIKQAQMMTDSANSVIEFYEAKKGALSGAIDDASQRISLYENRQKSLHDSNILLRGSASSLASKQRELDLLYKGGAITFDEYSQQSENVTGRLASLSKEIDTNSKAWWNDAKAIKDAKEQKLKDTFDFSSKWIAHEKATREMSAKEEYDAWVRVQARYKKGTELRKQADEQVYSAKKALIKEEETLLEKAFNKEKDQLNEGKKAELDAIDEAKRKFVEAQDVKIRAIEDQIKAADIANSDSNYDKTLKEKQDRLAVLQSAVGRDGKREKAALLKEIAKMQLDHTRDLDKRVLEAQKQTLEDDKSAQEKKYEQDKRDVEDHYKGLLKAFDNFTNDTTGRAETLKNIQIAKESEKNTTILANLNTFIAEYQKKMASITNLAQSQEQIDLQKYNANIDKWNTGNVDEKSAAHTENNALRIKYGVKDTGKLQHFSEGGVVQGVRGQPVPVIAHAGETIRNEMQESNLFRLLNFSMPQLKFSMPSFDMGKSSTTQITNNWTISSGDVNLHDDADIQTYFNERNDFVTRTQAVSGAKQR